MASFVRASAVWYPPTSVTTSSVKARRSGPVGMRRCRPWLSATSCLNSSADWTKFARGEVAHVGFFVADDTYFCSVRFCLYVSQSRKSSTCVRKYALTTATMAQDDASLTTRNNKCVYYLEKIFCLKVASLLRSKRCCEALLHSFDC